MISNALDLLMTNCYPNQKLQERELGIQHFLDSPRFFSAGRTSLIACG